MPTGQASGVRKPRGAVRRAPAHDQHADRDRDEGGQRPGIGQRGELGERDDARPAARRSIAVKMVIRTGEPRPDTRASVGGSRPSRAITKKIRLWP